MSNSIVELYDKWNIQIFVLLSLLLQIILILVALPFRQRKTYVMVILLADWVASFAVGLISNNKKYTGKSDDHAIILAFWAPFLLIHLGGPDNATAFTLEDNALWQRHLLGLLNHGVTTIIVFGQYSDRNKLWMPTVLVFVAGTIKYGERTHALFLANLNRFRESMLMAPDPGPNYAKIMEEYASKKEAKLPTNIELIAKPNKESKAVRYATVDTGKLNHIAEVQHAHRLFKIFKGLIIDLIFSFREREESRLFFRQRSPEEAIKVLAIELNFIYEVLYTKVLAVHSIAGYIVRFISWSAVVAAFSTFYSLDKHGFHEIDVGISYTLLIGAIGLDTIALFMLAFSDWTAASIQQFSRAQNNICIDYIKRCFIFLLKYYLSLKRINWQTYKKSTRNFLERARQVLFRRWSESLHQYNLINYCLEERCQKTCVARIWMKFIDKWLGIKDIYDQMKYVSTIPLTEELWNLIFEELKRKSDIAEDPDTAKKICSARGDWVLQNTDWIIEHSKLMHYIVDVDYDESLILWHIATELCYQKEKQESHEANSREFCKILSDYMLYLIVIQHTMMSGVLGIGQRRFRDTCAEAKLFFHTKGLGLGQCEDACAKILEVNTYVEPVVVKGDKCKSVLFDACILAKELRKIKVQKRWKLMSEVWVELLSYAASHCRANSHVAQLSEGGELITFVWLLMAHFGIGDQFQMNEGHPIAKLTVGK